MSIKLLSIIAIAFLVSACCGCKKHHGEKENHEKHKHSKHSKAE